VAEMKRGAGAILGLACWLLAGCEKPSPPAAVAADRTPGFWVWHRSTKLAAEEVPAGRVYRQIAEFGWREGKWSPRAVAAADVLLEREIPVVRLDPGPAFLERPDAAAMLAKW